MSKTRKATEQELKALDAVADGLARTLNADYFFSDEYEAAQNRAARRRRQEQERG